MIKENVDHNALARQYTNSDHAEKRQIKGMHLVKKMKEVRAQDRRVVMSEIENV